MSKHLNTNKQFMIGNGILAFAVIFIVVIFVYMSMRLSSRQEEKFEEQYTINLVEGFKGENLEIQVNDSTLFKGIVESDHLQLKMKRFASQSALLIIEQETHQYKMFNLHEEGGVYSFKRQNNQIEQVYVKE